MNPAVLDELRQLANILDHLQRAAHSAMQPDIVTAIQNARERLTSIVRHELTQLVDHPPPELAETFCASTARVSGKCFEAVN